MNEELLTYRRREERQISFSNSIQENASKGSSRNSSPSIAVENVYQLIGKEQRINTSPLRKPHAQYLIGENKTISIKCNQMSQYFNDAIKGKENQRRNIIPLNSRKNNDQNKSQLAKTTVTNIKQSNLVQNIFRTPLKDKNPSNQKGSNYSNMSSIKDEKTSTFCMRQRPKEISELKYYQDQDDQYERLSPSHYDQLSARYSVSRTERRVEDKSIVKGKDVDCQIKKLQKKIDQLQQMKKSMNIDFKESITNRSSKAYSQLIKQSTAKESIVSSEIDKYRQESSVKNRNSQAFSKTSDENLIKSQLVTVREKVNGEDIQMPKLLRNHSIKRIKCDKEIKSTRRTAEFGCPQLYIEDNQPKTKVSSQIVAKKTVSFSQASTSYSKISSIKDTGELLRLLSSLQNQIKLDDKLRKTKKWFQRWRYESKWNDLQSALSKGKTKMSPYLIKQIFSISSQEQNPFYAPRQDDFTLPDLVSSYEQSQAHWKRQIKGRYSHQLLSLSEFTEQKIDISKRGIISIEDIVRYINFQLDTVYRNRDIYLIFHRFKKTKTLLFEEIVQCLTQTVE